MSGLSIQEAAHEAAKMVRFFRVFEKLSEVINTISMSDQLIKERTDQTESLRKEIQSLSDQKALLVKGFDSEVYTARIDSENAANKYREEQKRIEGDILNLKNRYQEEEIKLSEQHSSEMKSRQAELNGLLVDIEKNSKLLVSAQKALDNLRTKLG
jgi:hypothetical protein